MNKTVKWILIVVAIIVAIAIIIYAVRSFLPQYPPPGTPPGPPPPPPGNVLDSLISGLGPWIQNLFFGNQCDPARRGFQKNGVYNPDKCGVGEGLGCDPNRSGWNLAGFMDPTCP